MRRKVLNDEWDFPVETVPVQTKTGLEVPDKMAIVRPDTDEVLSVVSGNYNLVKHEVAIDAISESIDTLGRVEIEEQALDKNGARLYISYKFPETTQSINSSDEMCLNLIATNSYDRSLRFGFLFGAYRYVCSNGLRSGLDLVAISQKHFSTLDTLIAGLKSKVQRAAEAFSEDLIPRYQQLSELTYDTEETLTTLRETYKIPKKIIERVKERESIPERVNAWDLYNNFTAYLTHEYTGSYKRKLQLGERISNGFGV